MPDNTPPADELFAVRDEIKRLTSRERELRALMLNDPSARTGNHYAADIKDVTTRRTDLTELRNNHPDIVDEFTYPVTTRNVVLRGINEDGEMITLRRKTA